MGLAKKALELPQGQLKKDIIRFLEGSSLKKAIYNGKSKKITTKDVYVVSKGKDRTKIRDLKGNELTVVNSQLTIL